MRESLNVMYSQQESVHIHEKGDNNTHGEYKTTITYIACTREVTLHICTTNLHHLPLGLIVRSRNHILFLTCLELRVPKQNTKAFSLAFG